jgi:hypothetical protein
LLYSHVSGPDPCMSVTALACAGAITC